MRMRTIEQTAAHIKAIDPETALTKTAIRRMVISGDIPSVKAGQKYLIDLDRLENDLFHTNMGEAAARSLEVLP